MKILCGRLETEARKHIDDALVVAEQSPCQKSKRGVVLVKDGTTIGRGYNHPWGDLPCEPEHCRDICNVYAMHAEEVALEDARNKSHDVHGARAYHIKVADGVGMPASGPSCVPCSGRMLQQGVREVVLLEERGLVLYDAEEFHRISCDAAREKAKSI